MRADVGCSNVVDMLAMTAAVVSHKALYYNSATLSAACLVLRASAKPPQQVTCECFLSRVGATQVHILVHRACIKSVVIFALLLFSAHASGKQRQGHALYSVTLVTPNPDAIHMAGPRKIILHPRSARLSLAYKQFFSSTPPSCHNNR